MLAVRHARKLRSQFRTKDPFKIAKRLGIDVREEDLPDSVQGMYYRSHGSSYIIINKSLTPAVKIFVCAHELGHHVLHSESNANYFLLTENRRRIFDILKNRKERQANRFAAALLSYQIHNFTPLPYIIAGMVFGIAVSLVSIGEFVHLHHHSHHWQEFRTRVIVASS